MDNLDQEILYGIRDAIARHEVDINASGLSLGAGIALLDEGRARWQTQPGAIVELTAAQLAGALAAARHEGMSDSFKVAQDVIDRHRGAAPTQRSAPLDDTRVDLRRGEPTAES
jgi:hypothetical protein